MSNESTLETRARIEAAIAGDTLVAAFARTVEERGDTLAYADKVGIDMSGGYAPGWRSVTWTELRERGLKVGVLSNTIWPRSWHEEFFRRDGVLHLLDGDVYTSEVPWTKPSPQVFEAAMAAVGVSDPARCVYVGDRLFEDVWGAHQAGMRAIHVPHSTIPADQAGHTEGAPDAVAHELAEVPAIVAGLCSA